MTSIRRAWVKLRALDDRLEAPLGYEPMVATVGYNLGVINIIHSANSLGIIREKALRL